MTYSGQFWIASDNVITMPTDAAPFAQVESDIIRVLVITDTQPVGLSVYVEEVPPAGEWDATVSALVSFSDVPYIGNPNEERATVSGSLAALHIPAGTYNFLGSIRGSTSKLVNGARSPQASGHEEVQLVLTNI